MRLTEPTALNAPPPLDATIPTADGGWLDEPRDDPGGARRSLATGSVPPWKRHQPAGRRVGRGPGRKTPPDRLAQPVRCWTGPDVFAAVAAQEYRHIACRSSAGKTPCPMAPDG